MNRTELREKLNKIDCDNYNQYDLVNLFESIKFSDEGLKKLSEMLENGASDKKVHDFLYNSLGEGIEDEGKKVKVHYYASNIDAIAEETFDYDYFMENKDKILNSYDEVIDVQVFDGDGNYVRDIDESLSEAYSYFETDDAVYFIHNDKHLKHRKDWDTIDAFKYRNVEIPVSEYDRAWRSINASSNKENESLSEDTDPKSARRERMNKFHKVFDSFGKCTSDDYNKAFDLFYDASVIDIVDHASKLKREYDGQKVKYRFTVFSDDYEHSADIHYDPYQNYVGVVVDNKKVDEDTIKQGNQWVNKGKEGTHGKFKTKKEADAQRKAMFAKGFGEGLYRNDSEEDEYDDFELASIYGGDFSYCPICGTRMEYDDGYNFCPKCKKSGDMLAIERRFGKIKEDVDNEEETMSLTDFINSRDFHTVLTDEAEGFDIRQWQKNLASELGDDFSDYEKEESCFDYKGHKI